MMTPTKKSQPKFSTDFLHEALAPLAFGSEVKSANWICTDSRAVDENALFIALHGERIDAHDFVDEKLLQKAAGTVVHRQVLGGKNRVVVVKDTERALQDLAHAHLMRMPALRIGLTGSNGKTTTKELLAGILSHACETNGSGDEQVLATKGNFNNHIGLPLTAFDVDSHHRFVVLEMGMNHKGEIARLAEIAVPQVGLITNLGSAHAGNLGGKAGVAEAKGELFASLVDTRGTCVSCADDEVMMQLIPEVLREGALTFGEHENATVCLRDCSLQESGGQNLEFEIAGERFYSSLQLEGRHNAMNAAAAVAAAMALGISAAKATQGLANVGTPPGRLQRKKSTSGGLVLDDSYNANPDSMMAGLKTLDELDTSGKQIAALGEMLELGDEAEQAHEKLGRECAHASLVQLFVCGDLGKDIARGAMSAGLAEEYIHWAEDSEKLALLIKVLAPAGASWLVKGSRGSRMERVSSVLTADVEKEGR
ncbi:MAG: UDP-N-acetylmuramoyl-tripeptide--D-alanyl-D-alanine ligase [Deltaproteobacteria bacterium]|nr:UDP-N-acetylmuramoyl-tripeptide--D-alanyl-D-alanine ligase [Deltaproteobacteria bacterium]